MKNLRVVDLLLILASTVMLGVVDQVPLAEPLIFNSSFTVNF